MSMEDLIQSMLGGGSSKSQQQSGGGLEDILGAIMGGGAQQQQQQSGGGLEDILGAIMGGGAQQQQQQSGGGLEDILGAIMGGGAQQQQQQSSGGLMDIISAILGGSGNAQQSASPIIEGVSGKTGLSSVIVQMILSFVMSKLLGSMSGGVPSQSGSAQRSGGGLDLDGLLEQMGQDKSVAKELAEQTGLDSQTAKKGLDEILGALGAQRQASSGQSQPAKKGGLDGLLENW